MTAPHSLPADLGEWEDLDAPTRQGIVAEVFSAAAEVTISHAAYIEIARAPRELPGGELAGMPFAVKDNIDVAGLRTRAGSPLLDGPPVVADAGAVAALREAGGLVVGKANMHELAFGVTSNNAAFGAVRNPYDRQRSAGGSSGGGAVAVALGAAAFSLGTDTGGSITLPASFCGVVGFRPTTGRYPVDGVVGLSWSRDTIGLHTRTVADAQRVDRIIARTAPTFSRPLAETIVAVPRRRYEDIDHEVAAIAERTLDALVRAGVRLVDVEIVDDLIIGGGPGLDLVLYESALMLAERARSVDPRIRSFADIPDRIVSPDVRAIAEMVADTPLPPAAYADARAARARLRASYAEMFETSGAHALIAPSCPVLPPPIGVDDAVELNGRATPLFPTLTRNTGPGSVAGVPMLTLPSGRSAGGLPVGMTYEGAFFADDGLLALGRLLETVESV